VRRAAFAAGLVLALSGCEPERVEETELVRFRFEATPGRPRIEVRVEEGSVEIEGVEGSRAIEADFVKRARTFDRDAALRLLPRVEVDAPEIEKGARFRFQGRVQSVPPFAGSLGTDLTLRVPAEVELEIETEDGDIRIERVSGRVRAENGDGRVVIERASGELRLRADDGSIIGRNLEGKVDAATDDGDIDLAGVFDGLEAKTADGDIRIEARGFRSSNAGWNVRALDGSIEVRLPAGAAAEIDAIVNDGRIVSRLPALEGRERGEEARRLRGKLGEGGPLLSFTALDGRIELGQNGSSSGLDLAPGLP
jgi:hypothetical protein